IPLMRRGSCEKAARKGGFSCFGRRQEFLLAEQDRQECLVLRLVRTAFTTGASADWGAATPALALAWVSAVWASARQQGAALVWARAGQRRHSPAGTLRRRHRVVRRLRRWRCSGSLAHWQKLRRRKDMS